MVIGAESGAATGPIQGKVRQQEGLRQERTVASPKGANPTAREGCRCGIALENWRYSWRSSEDSSDIETHVYLGDWVELLKESPKVFFQVFLEPWQAADLICREAPGQGDHQGQANAG